MPPMAAAMPGGTTLADEIWQRSPSRAETSRMKPEPATLSPVPAADNAVDAIAGDASAL